MQKQLSFLFGAALVFVMRVPTLAQAAAPPSNAPAAQDRQTLLRGDIMSGNILAYVNNTLVGTFGPNGVGDRSKPPFQYSDITRLTHGGANTLRLTWNESQPPAADFQIQYLTQDRRGNRSFSNRTLASFSLGRRTSKQGERSVTFTLPDAGRQAGGVSDEIKQPVAVGPPIATYANQAIMDVSLDRGSATVFINGQKVGRFGSGGMARADISSFAHPGQNNIRVQSDSGQTLQGFLKITYALVKDKFMLMRTMNWTGKNANKTVDDGMFSLPTRAGG